MKASSRSESSPDPAPPRRRGPAARRRPNPTPLPPPADPREPRIRPSSPVPPRPSPPRSHGAEGPGAPSPRARATTPGRAWRPDPRRARPLRGFPNRPRLETTNCWKPLNCWKPPPAGNCSLHGTAACVGPLLRGAARRDPLRRRAMRTLISPPSALSSSSLHSVRTPAGTLRERLVRGAGQAVHELRSVRLDRRRRGRAGASGTSDATGLLPVIVPPRVSTRSRSFVRVGPEPRGFERPALVPLSDRRFVRHFSRRFVSRSVHVGVVGGGGEVRVEARGIESSDFVRVPRGDARSPSSSVSPNSSPSPLGGFSLPGLGVRVFLAPPHR